MRLLLALSVMLVLFIPLPVSAFTPPTQGSENVTDVIIWYGDNVSIESANLTIESANLSVSIESLEEALVSAAEAQAEALNENTSGIAADYLALFIVALLIALVFWQRSIITYAIGAPVAIVYGLSLAVPSAELSLWVAGVSIAIIGTYFLYQIVMGAFDWLRGKVKHGN